MQWKANGPAAYVLAGEYRAGAGSVAAARSEPRYGTPVCPISLLELADFCGFVPTPQVMAGRISRDNGPDVDTLKPDGADLDQRLWHDASEMKRAGQAIVVESGVAENLLAGHIDIVQPEPTKPKPAPPSTSSIRMPAQPIAVRSGAKRPHHCDGSRRGIP